MTRKSRPNNIVIDLSDKLLYNVQKSNRTTRRPSMLVGYARTSTVDQKAGLDAQGRELKAAGCEKLFAGRSPARHSGRSWPSASLSYVRATR